jgi:ATP-binding cassette subfamily B protein
LIKARLYWQGATLIFISHDVSESLDFDRVWMMKDGQLVEDGQPQELAACPDSAYAQLLQREKSLRRLIWDSTDWIRLRLEKGKLHPVKEQGDAP